MELRRRGGLLLVVFGLILVGVWLVRVALLAQSLQGHFAQLRAVATQSDLAPTCEEIWATDDDLTVLRREVGALVTLAPLFRWMPIIGNDLDAAPHLLDVADALTDAGSLVCESFARSGVRDVSLGDVMRTFAENQATLQQAADAATRAEQAMPPVRSETFSPLLSSRVATLQRALPLVRAGLQVATSAPSLGGFDHPRTYLVLGLNEDELRPGGGFITGVVEVRVEAGRMVTMVFRDSYAVDDFSKPYPNPPEPLLAFMGIDQWVFRDANWSPDFPTAARQAIELYRPGGAVATIDGVIGVDQFAFQELVAAIGPLQVADVSEPITGANVVAYMRRAWAPSDGNLTGAWLRQRKSFMGPLAEAARSRIEAGTFDKIALAQTLVRLLEGKHVQIFVNQPETAAILREQGWDGALHRTSGDYLMVVDANVGYNKVSARVRQAVTYQVDLGAAPPRGEITLVYTNTANVNCPCVFEMRYDPVYEQMMNRCYWDYLRVYVPSSARLDDATPIPIPASALWRKMPDPGAVVARAADEGGFLSLQVPMVLPTTALQTRRYSLTLADNVVQWDKNRGQYNLYVQKQAGAPEYPVSVSVQIPEGSVFLGAEPQPTLVGGGKVVFRLSLNRDYNILLRFERR